MPKPMFVILGAVSPFCMEVSQCVAKEITCEITGASGDVIAWAPGHVRTSAMVVMSCRMMYTRVV